MKIILLDKMFVFPLGFSICKIFNTNGSSVICSILSIETYADHIKVSKEINYCKAIKKCVRKIVKF